MMTVKSKIFIYGFPLILGIIATVLMLRMPSGAQKTPKKEIKTEPAVAPVVMEETKPSEEIKPPEEVEQPPNESEQPEQPEEEKAPEKEEDAPKTMTEEEMRQMFTSRVEQISQNKLWLEFAKREDALLRCVKAVDAIAAGKRPVEPFDFLKPTTPFSAMKNAAGLLVVAVESIARFQEPADVFASIDTKAAADLFTELEPALNVLFHTLGYPEEITFRDKLTEACTIILETPVMEGEAELEHVAGQLYKYTNPQLEELQPVQKLIMRLGEKNREEIRRKVTDFATILKLYAE
ncbi:MAG: DUF3014 domain-containing protein [Lentisphaeria bacterium]|nr:DUF3014 domain-containing protein [Lentisphaeria bacterium]